MINNFECYHGTGKLNYEKIIKSQQFNFKPRPNHWLGDGVYFFVNDYKRAEWWAANNRPDKSTSPIVLYTVITIDDDELLNLDHSKGLDDLDDFAREFYTSIQRNHVIIKIENDDDLHEWQYKLLQAFLVHSDKKGKYYKGVLRTFEVNLQTGRSYFPALAKQFCVRDTTLIDLSKLKIAKRRR